MAADPADRASALVDYLLGIGVLTEPAVEAAFRAVSRHLFLPNLPLDEVYRDEAIPTKMQAGRPISSSSQPAIMAIMLEQLRVAPGQRLLEIGAGTGYNAALLGQLVGPSGTVITMDLDDDIVASARDHLAAAGSRNVTVVQADGGKGWTLAAPYDRIILTVGTWDITPAWLEQLGPGGRIVLPLQVANQAQKAVAFDRTGPSGEPRLISQSVRDCGFMMLRGAFAGPQVVTALGPGPGITLTTPGQIPVAGERVYQWLMSPARCHATGLQTTRVEAFGSLALWLDLHAGNVASLAMEGVAAPPGGWPCLFQFGGSQPTCYTFALLSDEGMAVVAGRESERRAANVSNADPETIELMILAYGPQGERLAQELLNLLNGWDEAERPASSRLRLRVYGRDYDYPLAPGEVRVAKRWTQMVVDWREELAQKV